MIHGIRRDDFPSIHKGLAAVACGLLVTTFSLTRPGMASAGLVAFWEFDEGSGTMAALDPRIGNRDFQVVDQAFQVVLRFSCLHPFGCSRLR